MNHRVTASIWFALALFVSATANAYVVQNFALVEPQGCVDPRFRWDPPNPAPPSGIQRYHLYREGVLVNRVSATNTGAPDLTWLEPGQVHAYTLRVLDNTGVEHPPTAPLYLSMPVCPLDPVLETRVIMVNFDDFQPQMPFTLGEVANFFFGSQDSVRAWTEDVSYGKQTLTGSVCGYFRMPHPLSFYCSNIDPVYGAILTSCGNGMTADMLELVDSEIDFTGVERVVVVWSGLAARQGGNFVSTEAGSIPGAWMAANSTLNVAGVVHELGHALNSTGHAASVQCPAESLANYGGFPPNLFDAASGGCSAYPYGDDYDAMGANNAQPFNAFHRLRMRWLDDAEVVVVTPTDQGQTINLKRLEAPGPGTKMIKIPLGNETFYFVEYRRNPEIDGVLVRLKAGYPATGDTFIAIDPATVQPFVYRPVTDPFVDNARNVKVNVISKDGLVAEVRVKRARTSSCGLGYEIVLLLPLLTRLARTRRWRSDI